MGTLEGLADRVTGELTVRTAFGDPITVGERTIVPVARVGYGFGGGYGGNEASDVDETDASSEGASATSESGGFGAGGGVRPCGVIEITDESTRFVPVRTGRGRRWAVTAALCAFLVGWLAGSRRSRNP